MPFSPLTFESVARAISLARLLRDGKKKDGTEHFAQPPLQGEGEVKRTGLVKLRGRLMRRPVISLAILIQLHQQHQNLVRHFLGNFVARFQIVPDDRLHYPMQRRGGVGFACLALVACHLSAPDLATPLEAKSGNRAVVPVVGVFFLAL